MLLFASHNDTKPTEDVDHIQAVLMQQENLEYTNEVYRISIQDYRATEDRNQDFKNFTIYAMIS